MSAAMPASRRMPTRAVGPLDELLAIEASGSWPASRQAYQSCLRRLAAALGRRDERTRMAVYRWLERELGALLNGRDPLERRVRREVLQDFAFGDEAPGHLKRAAARISGSPNLLSYLRARLIWDAKDRLETHRRRASRVAVGVDPLVLLRGRPVESPHRRVEARQLVEHMLRRCDLSDVDVAVLRYLADGLTITEAARRAGRSRQQVYRLLERMVSIPFDGECRL